MNRVKLGFKRWLIGGLAAMVMLPLLIAFPVSSGAAQTLTPLKLVLGWYPTPEYGGLYAAISQGYFNAAGINLTVQEGGPQVSPTAVVGSGSAQIGYLDNDEAIMLARQNGIPVTEFATTFQVYPEGIEYHSSHPISSFKQMNGKTLSAVTGSVDYEWLQAKYALKNQVVPYSYATFAHNTSSFLLGYVTDDVPTLAAQGVKIGYKLISSSGLNPYADVLFGLTSYVHSNSKLLTKFDGALGKGWQYYRNHYHQVDLVIFKAANTTPMSVNDAIAKTEDSFIYGGLATTMGIGSISASRVAQTYASLRALHVITKTMSISDIADTALVPKLLPPKKS